MRPPMIWILPIGLCSALLGCPSVAASTDARVTSLSCIGRSPFGQEKLRRETFVPRDNRDLNAGILCVVISGET